jgi:hypothetical protein
MPMAPVWERPEGGHLHLPGALRPGEEKRPVVSMKNDWKRIFAFE